MLYKFQAPFVFHTQVEDYEEINDRLYKVIDSRRGQEGCGWGLCDATTTITNGEEYNSFLEDPYFTDRIVWKPMDQMLEEAGDLFENPKRSKIINSWYNIYDKGQFQEIHNHVATSRSKYFLPTFSCIYIVKLDGPNSTVFTNYQHILGNDTTQRQNYDTSREPTVKEGTVLLFPYYLDHWVSPCQTNDRISITYNISSMFSG